MSAGWLRALFFPPRCIFCGGLAQDNSDCCAACAALLPDRPGFGAGPFAPLSGCAAPMDYSGFGRDKLLAFKDEAFRRYGPYFARRMACAVRGAFPGRRFDFVCCVPNLGGYNPAGELACRLAVELRAPPYRRALWQTREKQKQHLLPAEARRENVRGLYAVRAPQAVQGAAALLVDDVVTTGATMSACAQALLQAGAGQVWGAAAFCTA